MPEFRHDPCPFSWIGYAQLHAARQDAYAARNRNFLLAKHPANGVTQIVDNSLHDRIAIHLQKHMRSSLQIEAEHDGAGGHPFGEMRNQRLAMGWA